MLKQNMVTVLSSALCCGVVCLWSAAWSSAAQKKPKEHKPPRDREEYLTAQHEKQNRDQITKIAQGKATEAAEYFQAYLETIPDDQESMFGLVVASAQLNDFDKAMLWLHKSVDAGIPFERYLAGPRNLLEPLYDQAGFQDYARQRKVELIHGPVLGGVTDSRARFWVRTVDETPVSVHLSKSANMEGPLLSGSASTSTRDDFTAVVEVEGLEANRRYYYEVHLRDKPVKVSPAPSFRTFPTAGSEAKFAVVFGGGAGYTPWNERMWSTLSADRPLAMLALGDNVYIDTPEHPETQRYCYYRRQSRPEYREFVASNPIFAVWDDHDFGDNDCCNGPDFNEPLWKKDVLKVFTENFANPYYGGGPSAPGVWFDLRIGNVDFFFLDTRMYRDYPDTAPRSMLGPIQKQWLKEQLKGSTAAFKVIASSLPWASGAKPGSSDPWDGFPEEREEIFAYIEKNRVDGVVLISADRHRSDAWKIQRGDGYDLYDFMSSKLTNSVTHKVIQGALFGYNEKCSYGRLAFDTTLTDPQVTYTIVSIDGEAIDSLTLAKSQLTHD